MAFIQVPPDGIGKTVETNTPDGTNHRQVVSVGDKTTAANTLAINASGQITSNINGVVSVRPTDGTNQISKTFDIDTSGVTHEYAEGVVLRKSASGGSVEAGTSSNPLRTDPTGTTIQPVSGTVAVTGTFWQATQPVSGTFWQATQPVSGTFFQSTQPISIADGSDTTLGAKADSKSTATDTTAVSAMSVLKQISASVQAPPSQAVTNAGTFAVQATLSAETTKVIGTVNVAASQTIAVTNTGTFATQSTLAAETTKVIGTTRIIGNGGATLDAATSQNVAPPTNGLMVLGEFNTTPTTITTGNASPLQLDSAANVLVNLKTALPTGSNVIGKSSIDQTTPGTTNAVQSIAGTAGGWSVNSQTALTNSKIAVKASAGNFGGYMVYNPNASAVFIQVFDVASASVTLGTTAPTYVITLPATAAANVEFSLGITHATAITLAATTTATGLTAPGTALTGFFLFK